MHDTDFSKQSKLASLSYAVSYVYRVTEDAHAAGDFSDLLH